MELLNFLIKLHDQCLDLTRRLTFDKSFNADGIVVSLYGSLIELTGSLITLIESEKTAGVSSVFRTFLEAYVDFVIILNDRSYQNHYYAAYHKKWVALLQASKKGNRFLDSVAKMENLDQMIASHESELAKLKKMGFSPLPVFQRFNMAGMKDEYQSIYRFESGGVHNDLTTLLKRHFERGEDEYSLAIYKPISSDDVISVVDTAAGLLFGATVRIHEHLKSGCDDELKKLGDEFNAIRETAPHLPEPSMP